jgi:hypothetical protein
MQTFEAMLSLLVFVSILVAVLAADGEPAKTDDSLYRLQLAEDAWRVLYLRGDMRDVRMDDGGAARARLESDMQAIGDLTGFCVFMGGMDFTNCRGGDDAHEGIISIKRTMIIDKSPKTVTLTLSR